MRSDRLGDPHAIDRAVESALAARGRVVLAVSGGVDSTVLLHAAATVVPRERLVVATFDHGTGEAAAYARAQVARQAMTLSIVCVSGRAEAALRGEAALRQARWKFLRRVANDYGADAICTAHTRDDQVETVLMRVLRGAGARGLAGLEAGDIVRPMLGVDRAQVLAYARRHQLEWVDDPSNATPAYLRNRMRGDVLPALRSVRPTIDDELLAIGRAASQCRAAIEAIVTEHLQPLVHDAGVDVPVSALAPFSAAELGTLWPAIAASGGVTLDRRGLERVVAFALRGAVGARVQLSGGWEVVRSRTAFELRHRERAETTRAPAPLSDEMTWGRWRFRRIGGEAGACIAAASHGAWMATLPSNAPAVVRAWSAGDAMRLQPSDGRRKVKYFLSDAGVTGSARAGWPVVIAGDEIVWIPGVRRGSAASAAADEPGLTFLCEQISR